MVAGASRLRRAGGPDLRQCDPDDGHPARGLRPHRRRGLHAGRSDRGPAGRASLAAVRDLRRCGHHLRRGSRVPPARTPAGRSRHGRGAAGERRQSRPRRGGSGPTAAQLVAVAGRSRARERAEGGGGRRHPPAHRLLAGIWPGADRDRRRPPAGRRDVLPRRVRRDARARHLDPEVHAGRRLRPGGAAWRPGGALRPPVRLPTTSSSCPP